MAADPTDFPGLSGVAFLDCANQGPLPRVAVEAAREALAIKQAPYEIRDADYFAFPDAYRAGAAALVGADPEHVAVTDSATYGIMLVVRGLDWQAGDEVVLSAGAFPSNRFPWLSLERRGVRVTEVDDGGGPEGLARIADAITPRTRVVSTTWVQHSSGLTRDLRAMGDVCRAAECLFVVDASQGVGGLPVDLADTPCDLLTCAGYKWTLGPYGLGFAYLTPALGERLEPGLVNWFSLEGARNFNRLSECTLAFERSARRFDVNETANFINIAAGAAATRYVLDIGPAAVARHVARLLDRLVDGVPAGFRVRPAKAARSNIVCLEGSSGPRVESLQRTLRAQGIVVSCREGILRVSPHIYNTETDIDRLLEVLDGRVRPDPEPGGSTPAGARPGNGVGTYPRLEWLGLRGDRAGTGAPRSPRDGGSGARRDGVGG